MLFQVLVRRCSSVIKWGQIWMLRTQDGHYIFVIEDYVRAFLFIDVAEQAVALFRLAHVLFFTLALMTISHILCF